MCNTMMKTVIFLSISMIVYSEDNYHEATQKAILAPSINPSINSPIISPTLRIPIDNLCKKKITALYINIYQITITSHYTYYMLTSHYTFHKHQYQLYYYL